MSHLSNDRPLKCNICEYRTLRAGDLKKHAATHSDERPFKCNVCEHRARRAEDLKKHVATHSDERPFKCDVCEYRARRADYLKKHVATHSDERPFQCNVCEYRARRADDLKKHVATHTDQRPFKCDFCDYCTRKRSYLKMHIKIHSDERPFKCDICEYRARREDDLKKHAATHSNERPFKCGICEYRTRRPGTLKQHVATHSDERQFKCHICEHRSRRAGDLKTHVATHRDELPFKCNFCDFAAKLKRVLKYHIARRHSSKSGVERKIKRTVLSKRKNKFGQTKVLQKCRYCGNVFNRRDSLISHENICRKSKRKRISTKGKAKIPNLGNLESQLSDSKEVQSESGSNDVADIVIPLKPIRDDKRSLQLEPNLPIINHDYPNEIDQSKEFEIHPESDPDEPRNARQSNCTHSESIGSNFNQELSLNTCPSKRKFNTICPTITSEEIKKEPEPVSSANFSSEFDINCVKLENEAAMPLSANEAIYGPDSEASRRESSVKWEEPIDHLKNEFGFHNNGVVDHENQFTNKQCSIILTKLENSGNYLGCYYVRMKEPPYVYEAVKVNLNPVI